jgi:hypothetical protein
VTHHRHAIAQKESLVEIMGHQHGGDAEVATEAMKRSLKVCSGNRVERAERLVEKNHVGLRCQCSGYCHSLTLAAGQFPRPPLSEKGRIEPNQLERLHR